MPYSNPYYGYGDGGAVVDDQPVMAGPYDYAQPIDTTTAPASYTVVDPAMATFDAARDVVQAGELRPGPGAGRRRLKTLPNDTAMHEFRALCLFALKRYDDAAATLYAVLSVGPGWDWATLVGLYPDVEVYTAQLRALEAYCDANPNAAAGAVRAGLSLPDGGPHRGGGDRVQAGRRAHAQRHLVGQAGPPARPAQGPGRRRPARRRSRADGRARRPAPADTAPPQGASIAGTWNAKPAADTAIALTIQPAGGFTWQVTQKGKAQQFTGSSTYGDGLMTLVQEKGPALVGRVSWKDADHMTFRVVGDGPDDPGLSFSK